MSVPLQRGGYTGLSESVSSKISSEKSSVRCSNGGLNFKATELRLGLPGSESLDSGDNEKAGCPLPLQKIFVSGAKRGFSDAIDGASAKWVYADRSETDCKNHQQASSAGKNGVSPSPTSLPEKNSQLSSPAAKEQVMGWPPIRTFRKNSMVSSSKNNHSPAEKARSVSLYVKVSMDGAPYLRKIDLKTFNCYKELSSSLANMFTGFTIGHCWSHGISYKDGLNESQSKDLLHGSEYVLTYEDKDGDWMLVGDVPWDMFIDACKRMRIVSSSEAIGLAPRRCRGSSKPSNK